MSTAANVDEAIARQQVELAASQAERRRERARKLARALASVETKPVTVVRTVKHAALPAVLGALLAGWTGGWDLARIAAGAGIGGLAGALLYIVVRWLYLKVGRWLLARWQEPET